MKQLPSVAIETGIVRPSGAEGRQRESYIYPMKPLFLLTLLFLTNCNNNTVTGSIVGEWKPLAIEYDRVSEVDQFDVDTQLVANRIEGDVTFSKDGHCETFYSSGGQRCAYSLSDDKRKLFSFDCVPIIGDTEIMEIAHLDETYLVLINPADTIPGKENVSMSFLFKRK